MSSAVETARPLPTCPSAGPFLRSLDTLGMTIRPVNARAYKIRAVGHRVEVADCSASFRSYRAQAHRADVETSRPNQRHPLEMRTRSLFALGMESCPGRKTDLHPIFVQTVPHNLILIIVICFRRHLTELLNYSVLLSKLQIFNIFYRIYEI